MHSFVQKLHMSLVL